MRLISDTWLDSDETTSAAVSAGAVSGFVLLLIAVVMTTVLALVWRRYRIKARQRRFSQMSCMFRSPPHHRLHHRYHHPQIERDIQAVIA